MGRVVQTVVRQRRQVGPADFASWLEAADLLLVHESVKEIEAL
jgi:hypothetical protein